MATFRSIPKRIILKGNEFLASQHIGEADSLLNLVEIQAGFQKLSQYQMQRRLHDGTVIVANLCFGQGTVKIWSPMPVVAKKMVVEEEEYTDPWCYVYKLGAWDVSVADANAQALYDLFIRPDNGSGSGWQFPIESIVQSSIGTGGDDRYFNLQFNPKEWLAPSLITKNTNQWSYFDVAKDFVGWDFTYPIGEGIATDVAVIARSEPSVLGYSIRRDRYQDYQPKNDYYVYAPTTTITTQVLTVTDDEITFDFNENMSQVDVESINTVTQVFSVNVKRDASNNWTNITGLQSYDQNLQGSIAANGFELRTLPSVLIKLKNSVSNHWPLDSSSRPKYVRYVPFYWAMTTA